MMKNPPAPRFAIVLHECMEPLGLSVTEAAARLGVSRKQLVGCGQRPVRNFGGDGNSAQQGVWRQRGDVGPPAGELQPVPGDGACGRDPGRASSGRRRRPLSRFPRSSLPHASQRMGDRHKSCLERAHASLGAGFALPRDAGRRPALRAAPAQRRCAVPAEAGVPSRVRPPSPLGGTTFAARQCSRWGPPRVPV